MATFSTNQVRQLYVAKAMGTVGATSADGTIQVAGDTAKDHLYFKYKSPGGQVRSDLINIASITSAKATDASNLVHKLTKYKVALDSSINSGAPIAGQDYILRIAFRNHIGLSEENQYFKYGTVHAVSGMTAEGFYKTLLASLVKNFSRENSKLLDFYLDGVKATVEMTANAGITVTANSAGADGNNIEFAVASVSAATAGVVTATVGDVTTITASLTAAAKTIGDLKDLIASDPTANALITITGTDATDVVAEATAASLAGGSATGVIFEEAEQPWYLGTMPIAYMNFSIQPTTVYDGVEERIWGTVTKLAPTKAVKNGKMIADLEYFLMGERGDQYRKIGWPNTIHTTYLVDPSIEYNTIDIEFSYQGSGEDIQKSKKSVTLVVPKVGATNSVSNVLTNSIVSAIATATGLTITALGTEA